MFFNESYDNESVNVEASETGLTPDLAGVHRMIAESTEDWYNLREKMMRVEHVSIIREDAMLLEAGANDFFGRVSTFFESMLSRIKELWAKFVTWVNRQTQSDSEFVTKYQKVLDSSNADFSDFSVTVRDWKAGRLGAELDFTKVVSMTSGLLGSVNATKTAAAATSFKEKYAGEEWEKTVRTAIAGGDGSAKEFSSTIQSQFTNDKKTEKRELKYSDLNTAAIFAIIKDSKANVEAAQKEEKLVEKLLGDSTAFFRGIAKSLGGKDKASLTSATHSRKFEARGDEEGSATGGSYKGHNAGTVKTSHTSDAGATKPNEDKVAMRDAASTAAGAARKASSIASAAFGELISAVQARRGEYRMVVAKLASHKGAAKKETKADDTKSESYNFDYDAPISVLDQF